MKKLLFKSDTVSLYRDGDMFTLKLGDCECEITGDFDKIYGVVYDLADSTSDVDRLMVSLGNESGSV